MLHKLVKENGDILVIHHNFPLDKCCNKYLDHHYHNGACRMAKYAIAAENQGKYWDMANIMFENPPKDDKTAIEIAKKLNLDIKKFTDDINSIQTQYRLLGEIDEAISKEVDGTPTIVVNDRMYHGAKAYFELRKIITGK